MNLKDFIKKYKEHNLNRKKREAKEKIQNAIEDYKELLGVKSKEKNKKSFFERFKDRNYLIETTQDWVETIVFVIVAIIDSMYPTIMESFHKSKEEFDKKNKLLYAIVFYVCIIVSACISFFAKTIILILYGEAYLPSVVPLRIVTWYTAFSYLGVARNAWIVCNNLQNKLKYIYSAAALSNVLLNLLLIPKMGASGAALASLLAQFLTTMVIPFLIPSLRENSLMMLDAICLKK